jgi:hypothetical protein
MRYGVRFIDIGHMGQSDATLLSHGDEDDRASEREIGARLNNLGQALSKAVGRIGLSSRHAR